MRAPPKGDEQVDVFVAVFTDIPIREQRDMMERPFFSLSKTPRLKSIGWETPRWRLVPTHNGLSRR